MNATEANSVRLPAIAAVIYVALLLLVTTISDFGTPEKLPRPKSEIPLREYFGTSFGFAWSIATDLDFNSDEARDPVVASLANRDRKENARGEVLDGATKTLKRILWLGDWANSARFASCSILQDLDGDTIPDLAFGFENSTANLAENNVLVLSARRGATILTSKSRQRGDRFGHAICALGDVNGDLVPDLAIGAPGPTNNSAPGKVYIVSGKTGEDLRVLKASNRGGDGFGFSLASPGDLDGDGVADLVVGAPGFGTNGFESGTVFVFSLATGRLIRRHEGSDDNDRLGHEIISLTDRDHDGAGDYAIASNNGQSYNYVQIVSGSSGSTIMRVKGAFPGDSFGFSLCDAGDVNGDTFKDIAVGAPFASQESTAGVGYVRLISGKDGSILRHIRGAEENEHFGYDVAPAGDQDLDSKDDVFISSIMTKGRPGKISVFGLGHSE